MESPAEPLEPNENVDDQFQEIIGNQEYEYVSEYAESVKAFEEVSDRLTWAVTQAYVDYGNPTHIRALNLYAATIVNRFDDYVGQVFAAEPDSRQRLNQIVTFMKDDDTRRRKAFVETDAEAKHALVKMDAEYYLKRFTKFQEKLAEAENDEQLMHRLVSDFSTAVGSDVERFMELSAIRHTAEYSPNGEATQPETSSFDDETPEPEAPVTEDVPEPETPTDRLEAEVVDPHRIRIIIETDAVVAVEGLTVYVTSQKLNSNP